MEGHRIEKILSIVFSRPPATVGVRINSERKLASAFDASQTNIHRILDVFVEKGILTRHHGNGTFIRKVSSPERFNDLSLYKDAEKLTADTLCMSSSGRKMENQRLELSLWSDFKDSTSSNNFIADSICQRAEELGHSIVRKTLIQKRGIPLGVEDVAEEMRKTSHDGYIVIARWIKFFEQAVAMAWGKENIPSCYIMPCSYYVECEPYITLDSDNAIRRAVRIFAKEGYQRIGLIPFCEEGLRGPREYNHVFNSEAEFYGLEAINMKEAPFSINSREKIKSSLGSYLDQGLEALYLTDDNLISIMIEVLREKKLVPGRDIALITLSNRGMPLPGKFNWSRFEFDLNSFGKTIVDSLLNVINTAGENMLSFSHQGTWLPGDTHSKS